MNKNEKKKAIRVLHVLADMDKRFVLFENLVDGLEGENFEQTVCYLLGRSESENPLAGRFPIVVFGKKKPRGFKPGVVSKVLRIIKEKRIDIVHCQRHKSAVYGTLAAWKAGAGVKVVATVHGRGRTRNWGRRLANFVLFKRISKIVSVSNAVREDILQTNPGLPAGKVATVYNGIDAARFSVEDMDCRLCKRKLGLSEDGTVFGTVGRLSPVKGHGVLLDAFERLSGGYPEATLVLAGTGPLEGELKSRARSMIESERVRFLGFRDDIPEILAAVDCFVLPSFSEGHPLSLLEAMACERVVVASRVGGVPEILSSPEIGLTTEPGSVDSLAEAMEKVCRMPEDERAAMGKQSRRAVLEKYTTEKMVSATAALYESILS